MSEELVILQEYFESAGLTGKELTENDIENLKKELREAGEDALANFVGTLSSPSELLEYLKE